MNLKIKPLSSELINDYLDFFDNRAFTDKNPNAPCYCISANQSEDEINRMVSEFQDNGIRETLRKYAVNMLHGGKINGYLAFDGNISVGWCNAADMDSYSGFVPEVARQNKCGKTLSIVCFEIAPEYRGKGIASAFIEHICHHAEISGYKAVEGYPHYKDKYDTFDYNGPLGLYSKIGF